MAFSEFERDKIRTYLGFPRLYINANPFLESAITTIQSISDGGSAPDSSIEDAVRDAVNTLIGIDGYIGCVASNPINLAVFEVPASLSNGAVLKQDYRMAMRTLKVHGQDIIEKIAIRLGVKPIRPYFFSDGIQHNARAAYTRNPTFFGGGGR